MLYGDGGMRGCYTTKGVHIPGCMGCAVYGHSRCTCSPKTPPDVFDRLEKLERKIAKLERLLSGRNINKG